MQKSTAQDQKELVDSWYLRALEDSAALFERTKPALQLQTSLSNTLNLSLKAEQEGLRIAQEGHRLEVIELERRLAVAERERKWGKFGGKLRTAAEVVVVVLLIFMK